MIDYHVHLWPHQERADVLELRLDRLKRYCEQAEAHNVREIALTEHLFRFTAARSIADDFWQREPNDQLRSRMASYFDHHATADLDRYVTEVEAAKAAGLPIVLGLEVDYYPGAMDRVASLLDGYPFDVLLGSVHWLGTWMFDNLDDEVSMEEWNRRGTDDAWREYTDALVELAATKTCDVLAHPDLIKLTGRQPGPGLLDESYARMTEAAQSSGMTAEISSAGIRKPIGEAYPAKELLARFCRVGVPVTTASDAHGLGFVADRHAMLLRLARSVGYRHLQAYQNRQGHAIALSDDDDDPKVVDKSAGSTS